MEYPQAVRLRLASCYQYTSMAQVSATSRSRYFRSQNYAHDTQTWETGYPLATACGGCVLNGQWHVFACQDVSQMPMRKSYECVPDRLVPCHPTPELQQSACCQASITWCCQVGGTCRSVAAQRSNDTCGGVEPWCVCVCDWPPVEGGYLLTRYQLQGGFNPPKPTMSYSLQAPHISLSLGRC